MIKVFGSTMLMSIFLCVAVHAEVVDGIAAIVSGEMVTRSDLSDAITTRRDTLTKELGRTLPEEELQSRVLDELIDDVLFDKALEEASITVSDDDLARSINDILTQNRMSLARLKEELAHKGMTYEQYKKQIEREIRRVKFLNQVIGPQVKIRDQDLRDYYQRHQEKFRGVREARLAEIFFSLDAITTQEQFDELQRKTLSLFQKLQKQPQLFSELARKHSEGLTASNGGDLGMVNLKTVPPEIARATAELDVGDVSRPLLLDDSVRIIKLVALPELSASDFDRLRDDIYGALYDERIHDELNNFLLKERRKAFIDIR